MSQAYMPKSQTTEWETPHGLFDKLWDEFGGFDLDPCCLPEHHTAQRILENGGRLMCPYPNAILTADRRVLQDGLAHSWHGKVYMNPPYGAALREWVPKAVGEVEVGNAELIVALLPVRTDVKWWQGYVARGMRYSIVKSEGSWGVDTPTPYLWEVRFLPGRLKFVGAKDSATFPSAIVVWSNAPLE